MKTCRFCAEEIQDAAIVCKHCGRDLTGGELGDQSAQAAGNARAPSSVGRRLLIGALLVIAVLAIGALASDDGASEREESGAQQAGQPIARAARIIPIAPASEIDIRAGAIERIDWEVPPDQPNCHLTGRIEVTEGGNKDVQVFVSSADEYQNLVNGHTAKTYFSTDQVTVITLDVLVGGAGAKVLAIGNTFSAITAKRVRMKDVQASCT